MPSRATPFANHTFVRFGRFLIKKNDKARTHHHFVFLGLFLFFVVWVIINVVHHEHVLCVFI